MLFVCSRNKWRSRTAETIFRNHQNYLVKSAGTDPSAVVKINAKLLSWADVIFVMEKKHKSKIQEKFSDIAKEKEIVILNIPDEYQYMDEELISILEDSVDDYFRNNGLI